HRHPHDVWQQDDLLSFANFLMRVTGPGSPASPALNGEADALAKEAKDLKEKAKKLGEKAKNKSLPKDEITRLNAEIKSLNEKAQALEATGKRLKGTEVHGTGKPSFASVTSTLGKQDSKQFRLLGTDQAVNVPTEKDPREMLVAWLRRADNPFF